MASVVFDTSAIPVDVTEAVLAAAGLQLDVGHRLHRTCFDTFDGRLRAARVQLEARTFGTNDHVVTVSGGTGPPAQLPLATPLDPSAPLALEALPRGPLQARLRALAADRAMLPQVSVDCRRRSATMTDADGIPQVAARLDSEIHTDVVMTVPRVGLTRGSGAQMARGVEGDVQLVRTTIEMEALPGRADEARRLQRVVGTALQQAGASPTPRDGDTLTLIAEASGVDRRGWQGPVRPDLDRHAPALIGVRAVLGSFADALDANWEGAVDHLDDEFLHDLRIAVRQTRSLLTQGRRILPKDVRSAQREAFQWLGNVTSPARDLDVYIAGWGELTTLLDDDDAGALDVVLAHLAGQRVVAHDEVARALRSRTARLLRDEWRAWLDLPDLEVVGGKDADVPLGKVIGAWILGAQRQLLADGRRIDDSSPASQLHELRKDGKRLRYLLEGFGHLGGRRRNKAVLRRLKDLQDNLGAHQDAEVQAERLRRTLAELAEPGEVLGAGDLPPQTLVAGHRLALALDDQQATERAGFHDHFAAYASKRSRRTLEELAERIAR